MKLGLIGVVAFACGCPGGGKYTPPWGAKEPTAAEEAARLEAKQAAITSFRAESVMDYWLGNQRIKGTVKVMGKPGAFVRLNALSPAGGDVIADLSCDGSNFVMLDKQNNCVITGPCDEGSISQFFHVPLAPDDLFHLATGTTPFLGTAQKLSWDASAGQETITLEGDKGTQTIVVDARDGHTDVVSSHLQHDKDAWTITNKDFHDVTAGGQTFRVPAKSRFEGSAQKSDLIVEWNELDLNLDLDEGKFHVAVPDGLPACH